MNQIGKIYKGLFIFGHVNLQIVLLKYTEHIFLPLVAISTPY